MKKIQKKYDELFIEQDPKEFSKLAAEVSFQSLLFTMKRTQCHSILQLSKDLYWTVLPQLIKIYN